MEDKKINVKKWVFLVIGVIVVTVLAYGGLILYLTWPISEYSISKSGVFGDSFGLLTALFSGLAFGGLIITILLQREDLQLQSKELSLTRKEIKNQNFENTFFQMLRLHNEILNSIVINTALRSGGSIRIQGRDCFVRFCDDLHQAYQSHFKTNKERPEEDRHDRTDLLNEAYCDFWAGKTNDLGHYYRYLYRIFKFIDESECGNKSLYSSIARAQISNYELLLMFYNCLSTYGRYKFKPLIEKYALFDNLPMTMLFAPDDISLYKKSAWGTNNQFPSLIKE